MASNPSPAFLFYVKDWRSSRRVQRMNFATRGMYLELLLEQWETGGVPATPDACADLLGGTPAEWARAWPQIKSCFTANRKRSGGLLVNPKLEAVRRERLKFQKLQAENGLRGARKRWQQHGKPIGSPSQTIGAPMAKNGSSSSSSFASSSASSRGGAPPPPTRSKPQPVFKGQRLTVFEWQQDQLTQILGPLTEAFDLRAWFHALDARTVEAACVIPLRDNGAWLQEQTLAEAQRRGLPVAVSTSTTGKQTSRLASAYASIQSREASPR